jgi:hypothetical protein
MKIGAAERRSLVAISYLHDVDENDPSELVAALRSQVDANVERLRRSREMVEVMNQHLEPQGGRRRRRRKKMT